MQSCPRVIYRTMVIERLTFSKPMVVNLYIGYV